MKEYVAENLTATQQFAKKLARTFKGGEVIGLIGDLGAGKTTLVQFLAQTLGVKETVNSPTFVLMKIYRVTRNGLSVTRLVHVDAYRLNSGQELTNIGLSEYLGRQDTVVVIEWADKVKEILPIDAVIINIKEGKEENQRIFQG